jgi:hypothetical protein
MKQPVEVEITCTLYSIESPSWHQITDSHKESIADQITDGGWQIVSKLRRGFLNCKTKEDIIYGYYAQEGNLRIEQFDEKQRPSIDKEPSFERLLFLLFLDSGILVVQSIRISRYMDLTGPKVKLSLFDSLDGVFRKAGLAYKGHAKFERYKQELTREELLSIFEKNAINRVIIKDLWNSSVPDNFRFFNPNFDADAFMKSVIQADLQLSEKVEWEGKDIQKAKIARGLMYAGNPQLIQGTDENGETREWEQSTPETITLDLNTNDVHFPEEDLEKLLILLKRRYGVFSERVEKMKKMRKSEDLPLFDQK